MPIKSYLVYPKKGKQQELNSNLSQLPFCDVSIAENQALLVLTTDTRDELEEEKCEKILNNIDALEYMTLVSGFEENTK